MKWWQVYREEGFRPSNFGGHKLLILSYADCHILSFLLPFLSRTKFSFWLSHSSPLTVSQIHLFHHHQREVKAYITTSRHTYTGRSRTDLRRRKRERKRLDSSPLFSALSSPSTIDNWMHSCCCRLWDSRAQNMHGKTGMGICSIKTNINSSWVEAAASIISSSFSFFLPLEMLHRFSRFAFFILLQSSHRFSMCCKS